MKATIALLVMAVALIWSMSRSGIAGGAIAMLTMALVAASRMKGAARRVLRDKIGDHEIHFFGTGLDLGAHDERDEA